MRVVVALTVLGFVGVLALMPVPVVDLWWQMKAGQLIAEGGGVPHADPFSYTAPGARWVVQEWAPSLLFYRLYTGVGPAALVWYKILLAVVAFGFVFWRCVRRTGRWLLSGLVTVLGAMAARTFIDMRPQMLTYALFAALLLVLDEHRRRPESRWVWAVPPLMLLWANLHAGFMLGFFALGVYAVGEGFLALRGDTTRRRSAAGIVIAGAVAAPLTLLQPNGLDLWRYPFMLMGHDVVMGFILEWKSPDFHASWVRPYEVLLLTLLLGASLARPTLWLGDLILLLCLAHGSLTSIRHIPVFALAVTPMLAQTLAEIIGRLEEWLTAEGRLAETTLLATVLGLLVLAFGAIAELRGIPRRDWFGYAGAMRGFPVQACDVIDRSGWTGRLFNDYKWGGYCIWRFYPRRQVFIDGRAEIYFESGFDDYYAIHNVHADWAARLSRWRVDTALLDRSSYLARVMEVSPEWQRVYGDDVATIFRRRQPFARP